jgi:hypothetical protein
MIMGGAVLGGVIIGPSVQARAEAAQAGARDEAVE